jgi:hypothetical protein
MTTTIYFSLYMAASAMLFHAFTSAMVVFISVNHDHNGVCFVFIWQSWRTVTTTVYVLSLYGSHGEP